MSGFGGIMSIELNTNLSGTIKFLENIQGCQLYKYKPGDVFPKHIDLSADYPNRRYNLGVNLNENYNGGEYQCWAENIEDETMQIIPKNTGTICLYHSRQLHEIKEITEGERWSLVIKIDADIINAGKQTVTLIKGASIFSSSDSFAMIRGGHVDLTILGAFEVDCQGNIASYMIPGKLIKGMGGAMDLVASAQNIIVAMQHVNKAGESKLLPNCTLPLTGVHCVKKIVTELAVLAVLENGGFQLLERAPGVSVAEIQAATAGKLLIEGDIPEMQL